MQRDTVVNEYSEAFKANTVREMVGAGSMSAHALSVEMGLNQSTLSRWLRDARNVGVMNQPPKKWTTAEKLRLVVDASKLGDEALGEFLRREGLHKAQVDEWRSLAEGSFVDGGPRTDRSTRRRQRLDLSYGRFWTVAVWPLLGVASGAWSVGAYGSASCTLEFSFFLLRPAEQGWWYYCGKQVGGTVGVGKFSANGFRVVGSNALDLISTTQAVDRPFERLMGKNMSGTFARTAIGVALFASLMSSAAFAQTGEEDQGEDLYEGGPTHPHDYSFAPLLAAGVEPTIRAEFDAAIRAAVEQAVAPNDVSPNRGFLRQGDPRGAQPSTTWVCNSSGATYTGQVTVISGELIKKGEGWRLVMRRNVVPCVGRAAIVDAERAFVGGPRELLGAMPGLLAELIDAPDAEKTRSTPAAWKAAVFVLVPAGPSAIGCVASANPELGCFDDEPTAAVQNFDAFEVMRSEVTTTDYAGCVEAGLCGKPTLAPGCNYAVAGREQHPMNCVTWMEARAFCAAVSSRLPSPEEWEHASRGTTTTLFPWGDAPPDGKTGNLCDRNCPPLPPADEKALPRAKRIQAGLDDGYTGTAPVGSFLAGANAAGVLDLAGNVWEWTDGDWRPGLKERRGGSFIDRPRGLRIGNRNGSMPETRMVHTGFRCVR